jgi:prevent-host-death family protein
MGMAKTLPTGAIEVGVKELRADLSGWIDRVRGGAQIVVTSHGTPVARLNPYAQTGLERLIAEGKVRLPTHPKTPADTKGVPVKGNVSDFVSEQRR